MNKEIAAQAKEYKRRVAGGFMLVDGSKINEKISGEDFFVTKKIDGEMRLLSYSDGKIEAYGSHGNETDTSAACFAEFAQLCKKAGIKDAIVAAELYAAISETGRERVSDVKMALADSKYTDKLSLAPFDIVSLDGQPFRAEHYKDTHAKLSSLFKGKSVNPVEGKPASSKQEVEQIYSQWVVEGKAEGVVVHSEQPIVFKVKPRHTIDAVIIGYTLRDDCSENMIRDIMVAVMTENGGLHQFATLGNGFSEAQRTDIYAKLSKMHVASEFIFTDSRNVAYQMVKPEIVVEISVIDLVAENSKGEAKMDALLNYTDDSGFIVEAQVPGVSAMNPVFERIRNDKSCNATDIRISQLTDLCPFSEGKIVSLANLPNSELIERRIYTKGEGAKLMIQKYAIWKTNKEQSGIYPAYVLHYTDFSLGRKDQLKRDIRASKSEAQIRQLMDEMIAENVKKGWVEAK